MEFKGKKKFNLNYHTTMHLPYKYIISDIQETYKEAEANALLISKAPEMLDLLIEVMETTTDKIRYKKCKQLIKEATEI